MFKWKSVINKLEIDAIKSIKGSLCHVTAAGGVPPTCTAHARPPGTALQSAAVSRGLGLAHTPAGQPRGMLTVRLLVRPPGPSRASACRRVRPSFDNLDLGTVVPLGSWLRCLPWRVRPLSRLYRCRCVCNWNLTMHLWCWRLMYYNCIDLLRARLTALLLGRVARSQAARSHDPTHRHGMDCGSCCQSSCGSLLPRSSVFSSQHHQQ